MRSQRHLRRRRERRQVGLLKTFWEEKKRVGEREGPLCRRGACCESRWGGEKDGESVQIRGVYTSRGRSASTDLMTGRLQSDAGSLCTAPINSEGGDSWWTSLLLACEECRSASKKSKKEKSWRKWQMQSECAWYASLAQLWTYCFLLHTPPTPPPPPQPQPPPPPPPRRLMCGKYNTTLQMMSLVALQRCPLAAAELNYSTLGNKKGKILPLFIQRISKVARMLKSFQLSRARPPPLPAHPTYHCLRAGGGRSLIGLHFKHICHVSANKFLQGRSADSKKQRFYQQLLCSLANVQNHSILKSADCNQSSFCTVTDRCRVLWWWVKVEHWSLRFVANNSTMNSWF